MCKVDPTCGLIKLRTFVLTFAILGLVINSLGLAGSIYGLFSYHEICFKLPGYCPRCLFQHVIYFISWFCFGILLVQVLSFIFLLRGVIVKNKCLIISWIVVQTINIPLACFVYVNWLQFTIFELHSDMTLIIISTIVFLIVLTIDVYFWILVALYCKMHHNFDFQVVYQPSMI